MPKLPPTFQELAVEKLERSLVEYRKIVARSANGEQIAESDHQRVKLILDGLELPGWAFTRDIVAVATMRKAKSDHEARELLMVYPHLFADAREYVSRRRADRLRRRAAVEAIRKAAG